MRILLASLACLAAASNLLAQAVPVTLKQTGDTWTLVRDGKPYLIKGGGGSTDLDTLVKVGGNSIRTWGADQFVPALDEAHKRGLTVTAGLWLGHPRHGFDYNNPDMVAKQLEECRQVVMKYKDHPAIIVWGIGNEMEADSQGNNAAVWSAINNIAAMVKKLDPNHPTMTVTAGISPAKVKNVHRLCPDIDIFGINSYGPAAQIPKEYRDLGGTKPYILAEFGPRGSWESPSAPWAVPFELTSTQKAEDYRNAYQGAVLGSGGLCLGSYAFIWGHKQEATDTWFGLFLATGERTAGVDVLTELWSGKPAANLCPIIEPIKVQGIPEAPDGTPIFASVVAKDPEGDALTTTWVLMGEPAIHANGGDAIPPLKTYPEAIKVLPDGRVECRLPTTAEKFRLYAIVTDKNGGAATANVPLLRQVPLPKK